VDQLFLPLDSGGFGFTSASRVALVGYIASWALVGQTVAEALGPTALEGEGEQRRLRDDWVPGLVGALAQPALAGLEALAQVNTASITQVTKRKLQSAACRELAMAAQQRVADSLPTRELRVAFLSATHPYAGVALATSPQINKIENEDFRLLVLHRLLLPALPGGLKCPCKDNSDMDVYGKHAAACTSHNPTSRHDYVLAKLERSVRAVLGSKYEVVIEHAMNALFKRAAGVEKAKIADMRVRTKQVPGGVPTDLWVDMVITHPTVGGHFNSYFTQPQGAGELRKDASLAATQKEELKAKQYIKAFPSMQATLFFGVGWTRTPRGVSARRSLLS
jgi:hypothetical protein